MPGASFHAKLRVTWASGPCGLQRISETLEPGVHAARRQFQAKWTARLKYIVRNAWPAAICLLLALPVSLGAESTSLKQPHIGGGQRKGDSLTAEC